MRWFGFLFSARFWMAAWVVILFVGLTPLPPVAELVIVVAFVAHSVWFVQRRVRQAAMQRALARAERAEEAEFRRRRRRRARPIDSTQLTPGPKFPDPNRHGVFIGWSIDQGGDSK
jgi:hypothetical protein